MFQGFKHRIMIVKYIFLPSIRDSKAEKESCSSSEWKNRQGTVNLWPLPVVIYGSFLFLAGSIPAVIYNLWVHDSINGSSRLKMIMYPESSLKGEIHIVCVK